jgi:hypothetical protein
MGLRCDSRKPRNPEENTPATHHSEPLLPTLIKKLTTTHSGIILARRSTKGVVENREEPSEASGVRPLLV